MTVFEMIALHWEAVDRHLAQPDATHRPQAESARAALDHALRCLAGADTEREALAGACFAAGQSTGIFRLLYAKDMKSGRKSRESAPLAGRLRNDALVEFQRRFPDNWWTFPDAVAA